MKETRARERTSGREDRTKVRADHRKCKIWPSSRKEMKSAGAQAASVR